MAVVAKHLIVDLSQEIYERKDAASPPAEAGALEAVLSSEAHTSPARNLQVELEARIQGDELPWSRRRMLTLAIGSSALVLVGSIIALLYMMTH